MPLRKIIEKSLNSTSSLKSSYLDCSSEELSSGHECDSNCPNKKPHNVKIKTQVGLLNLKSRIGEIQGALQSKILGMIKTNQAEEKKK